MFHAMDGRGTVKLSAYIKSRSFKPNVQEQRSDQAYTECLNGNLHEAVSAWFLGPQAENLDLLKGLFAEAAELHAQSRLAFYPEDGAFITDVIRESAGFKKESEELVNVFKCMTKLLYDYAVPFYSQRYAGHMNFDVSLPGILGWVTTVLSNPNNVAFEASPITTQLEIFVGYQLCEMLGYERGPADKPRYWGHIACDGTVANLESIWVARNLKYYPFSLRDAMKPGNELEGISESFKIVLPTNPGTPVLFSSLDKWQLLNIPSATILDIPEKLHKEFGITQTYLDSILNKYIVQTRGKQEVESEWGISDPPRYFISRTRHYSWPKGAAIAGLGSKYMMEIDVDRNARVDIDKLHAHLEDCLQNKKPVFAVVSIMGSTEEGSVDSLDKILDLRDEYERKGLCFLVHADAAWGGYFASMIRDKVATVPDGKRKKKAPSREFVPSETLRKSTIEQLHALGRTDTITIDPHKAGYIPYPAGGLCYRDGRMRYLVTWSAPYVVQADNGESIGIYGVEGSKPGAPAVASFLHHTIVGLHKEGHGALLGEATWSCRRISAHWAAMSVEKDPFLVVPFNPLSSEPDKAAVEREKQFIREHILGKSNEQIVADKEAKKILCTLGSDLNINAFACNFRIGKEVNTDVEEANYLNNSIYRRLSITVPKVKPSSIPMYISSTTFKFDEYGDCVTHFKERMGLETESQQDLFVLRNVVMSPFQTAGGFVQNIADIFQKVLEEEMQHVVARNTITPQKHSFVTQGLGSNSVFLTYRPYFHNANGRFQAILSANIESPIGSRPVKYAEASYEITTNDDVKMEDICKDGASFSATLYDASQKIVSEDIRVTNIRVIKLRPLNSQWRDTKYLTTCVPFYLYGKDGKYFIDHMLLQAPNVQLSAPVTLDFSVPADHLTKGALLSVSRSEAAMQPADVESIQWFAPGATLEVSVFADPNASAAHGPGLASSIGKSTPIAKGKMTIGKGTFIDWTRINNQDFTKEQRASHRMVNFASGAAPAKTKEEWRHVVESYFK